MDKPLLFLLPLAGMVMVGVGLNAMLSDPYWSHSQTSEARSTLAASRTSYEVQHVAAASDDGNQSANVANEVSSRVTLQAASAAQRRAAEQPLLPPIATSAGKGFWERNAWLVELLALILLPIVGAFTPMTTMIRSWHLDNQFRFSGVSYTTIPVGPPVVVSIRAWLVVMALYYFVAYVVLGGWPLTGFWQPIGRLMDL